jgi:hypothetical protein
MTCLWTEPTQKTETEEWTDSQHLKSLLKEGLKTKNGVSVTGGKSKISLQ